MQKFALKLLLTRWVFTRRSRHIEGIQIITTLATLVLIVFVGLYVWAHGGI